LKMFRYKQCIVVRGDLKLSRGKWCAQTAHAAVGAALIAKTKNPEWFEAWISEGQKKVVLFVSSLKELYQLEEKAEGLGLPVYRVEDMGLTEVPPHTVTCIAIGPAPEALIDRVTGNLPLFK